MLLNERNELFAGRLAVTESDIRAAFSEFSGVIEQYPPKYSPCAMEEKGSMNMHVKDAILR